MELGEPVLKGVMSIAGMVGGPRTWLVGARHWAFIVVPCGIEAIRVRVAGRMGSEVVAGTCIQRPGSKWIWEGLLSAFPVRVLVTSLMIWA